MGDTGGPDFRSLALRIRELEREIDEIWTALNSPERRSSRDPRSNRGAAAGEGSAARARAFRRKLSRSARLEAIARAKQLGTLPPDFTEADALARIRAVGGEVDWVFDAEPIASPQAILVDPADRGRFGLWASLRAARIAGQVRRKDQIAVRDVARAISDAGDELQPTTYGSGARARTARGEFLYPDGTVAVSTSGDAHYPSGRVGLAADGTLRYPNGHIAIAPNGKIRYPGDQVLCTAEGEWRRANKGPITLNGLLNHAWRARPGDREDLEAGLDALRVQHGEGLLWRIAILELVVLTGQRRSRGDG